MKLSTKAHNVIPDAVTKFPIQLVHILVAIAFLSPTIIEFY
jgi:hypothetical protein